MFNGQRRHCVQRGCAYILTAVMASVGAFPAHAANAITGPLGFGAQRFVAGTSTLNYRVDFENLPGLTAGTVQVVRVTVPLDPGSDLVSFRLGNAGFGGASGKTIAVPLNRSAFDNGGVFYSDLGFFVQYTAGVDPLSRLATFAFSTLGPDHQPPVNPLVGFLPVNDATGRGLGYVTFSLRPSPNAATGSVLSEQAEIRFDQGIPVSTNTVSNALDAGAPHSQVVGPVIPLGTTDAQVHIEKSDAGGSGVDHVDLYAAQDGGPFTLIASDIVSGITGSDTTVALTFGHAYRFFSRATDRVGNVEPLKNYAEASLAFGSAVGVGPAAQADGPAVRIVAASAARVVFSLANATELSIDLFDVQGRPVQELATRVRFEAGLHEVEFPQDGIQPGLYFVQLRTPAFRAVRKVVRQ